MLQESYAATRQLSLIRSALSKALFILSEGAYLSTTDFALSFSCLHPGTYFSPLWVSLSHPFKRINQTKHRHINTRETGPQASLNDAGSFLSHIFLRLCFVGLLLYF